MKIGQKENENAVSKFIWAVSQRSVINVLSYHKIEFALLT